MCPRSFQWYQSLFGQPATQPGHSYFRSAPLRLGRDGSCSASTSRGAHDHPSLKSAATATPGNGLLLFFRVDDFAMALEKAPRVLVPHLPKQEPHRNPSTGTESRATRSGRILRHHRRALCGLTQSLFQRAVVVQRAVVFQEALERAEVVQIDDDGRDAVVEDRVRLFEVGRVRASEQHLRSGFPRRVS